MCTSVFLMPIHTCVYSFTYRYMDLDIDRYIYICVNAIYTERSLGTYVSTYACAHVWMYACARSVHSSVRVRTRLCVSARACARERRERRRNPSARPPNVCHCVHMYVGTSTWERMYMHMCVRVDPMQACARARACLRARRERRRNPRSRPLAVSHYVHIYVGMSEPICICKRAYIEYMSARICVCVSACAYVRVSARRERRGRARPQDLHIYVYV